MPESGLSEPRIKRMVGKLANSDAFASLKKFLVVKHSFILSISDLPY
jgi:hypothetical protein